MENLIVSNQTTLIPLKQDENGQVIIDGRELHEFLKVQQDFSDWIKKQLELTDSIKDVDFITFPFKREQVSGAKTSIEYLLSLDTAKEICMIAGIAPRTNKETKELSKQARQYFIQVEKAWNSPEMIMKRALEFANKQVEKLTLANAQKDQIINELKPKADYTDLILKNKGLVTITQIAKDYGMSGQELNKTLHELKVQYKQSGQWLLYSSLQDKGYTHSETINITRGDGRPDISMITKWTQKGRLFLYDLLKENCMLPLIER